ncbi:hypothetical protein Sru01_65780 [Sphaerisporangium rufum]|uniref:Uncharacterized protein n=1 Tax=Sphaerisporangium rufum TaxID=1381558 RepID=A0A919V1Z1_9ACTN|nr:hypothetical protein [Sphaerisporangium rufum]GII81596.1 hypothetical protein Sru01_65780 [Sphaerisporangium rufum]
MVKAMATRLVAAMVAGRFGWGLAALAMVVVVAGAVPVPSGISWT